MIAVLYLLADIHWMGLVSEKNKIYKAYVEGSNSSQSCDETALIRWHWKSTIKREYGEKNCYFVIIV